MDDAHAISSVICVMLGSDCIFPLTESMYNVLRYVNVFVVPILIHFLIL